MSKLQHACGECGKVSSSQKLVVFDTRRGLSLHLHQQHSIRLDKNYDSMDRRLPNTGGGTLTVFDENGTWEDSRRGARQRRRST